MAPNLKALSFYGLARIDDRKLAAFMEWLLEELTDPERIPLGPAKDVHRRSNLIAISVELVVDSSNGLNPSIAAALSELFLDEHQYPMLEGVLMHLAIQGEESSAEHREEVELAMLPCTEKGLLYLMWDSD
jgi:hypothetical protein